VYEYGVILGDMGSTKKEEAVVPDLEILSTTLRPGGYIEPPSKVDGGSERSLIGSGARFRQNPLEFLKEVSLHMSGTGWRAYDNIIGQPIFYKGFSENMKAAVMSTGTLESRIRELAEKRIAVEEAGGLLGDGNLFEKRKARRKEELEESLRQVASDITDNMICKMESNLFIKGAYYLSTQLLTRAYHQGIHVSSEEVIRLRDVAAKAATSKHSIVFLPCHRSHVDYVSLQVICYRLGISLPTVVAGDNLALPGLKQFLQHAGAMWIRRSFAGDALYTTVVQSYIDSLLRMGLNIEAFIEGGRSRTGKLLPPKFGILSFIMDAVISGRCDDAIICPVSTQYDKVIETEGYVSELLGQPKPKENLMDLLSSSSILSLKLGRVDVRFHEPWSLKAFITDQQARMTRLPTQAHSTPSTSAEMRVRLLRTMGYKVLFDINAVSVMMPTTLVGAVLLTLRGRGCGKSELVRRVEWLSARVQNKGGRVAHLHGAPTGLVVERAIEVLGPTLVGRVDDLLEPTFYAVDRFQLSFYRNGLINLFVNEALLAISMYTRVKLG
jgi:glycerol-3-phosphate O-acyltransferase